MLHPLLVLSVHLIKKKKKFENHSRLAELDQVLVCGARMEAADIQVRFTQLFPSAAAAVAATVGVGTRGRHLVAGGHIGLLQWERKNQNESIVYEHTTEVTAKILNIFQQQSKNSDVSYYWKCEKLKRSVSKCWEIESNPARDRWLCGSCEKWYHTGLMSTLTNTAFWGECGASWLPTPYREKGPLMLSPCWVTSFSLSEPQKKFAVHIKTKALKI